MMYILGYGLIQTALISAPSMILEYSGYAVIWVGSSIYNYYYPTLSEIDKLHLELEKLRFEINETNNYEWQLI